MSDPLQESRPLILTIDDDEMIGLMLKDVLSCKGFDVLTAADARTGLTMFLEHRPELILLDVLMPEMDGFACLETLRAMPETRLLPIVMLTGIDDVESIHRCFGLGATDFIAKPINWPTLPYRLNYMIRASEALKELAHNEAVLRNTQKIAHLGNWDWERCTDHITWSEEALRVLDVAPKYFYSPRLALFKTVHPPDLSSLQQALELCIKQGRAFSLDIQLVHTDETEHVAHIQGEAEMQQGRVEKIHGTIQDITERRRIEDQVHHLSCYDPLTSLPNRTLFKTILNQAISHCERNQLLLTGLFVRIDRFKRINETLGAAIGDRVLQMFAQRMMRALRNSDYIAAASDIDPTETTVSRLGDSEFIVMLNYIRDARDTIKVVNRIFKEIAPPFEVEGNEIYLGANIGIVVYPEDGKDVDTFIKNGEFAMNHAREQGQNCHQFFNKILHIAAFHKLSLENSMRHALERNELVLHYQAKVDLLSNQTIGMEALVRWQHPVLGLVPPDQFIPIAEESGLIIPIGAWVLATACRQLHTWQLEGMPPLVLAVNVSACQFRHKDFFLHLCKVLDSTGLSAQSLKLELTESTLMMDINEAMAILREIRTLGVRISIDDFGTGYSSLSYLKKLPISELKIDQSFIRDLPNNEDDNMIASAIIALAKSLSLEVVAEGVENQQQLDFLRQHGCDTVQGYLFSKPLPPEQFSQFMLRA